MHVTETDVHGDCTNFAGTKYTLPAEKMDKYMAIPGPDYIEILAYLNKVTEVLRRELGR